MNVSGPKERATFSIAADIKGRLDAAVPKSERSRFVEKAIDQALREVTRGHVKSMLDSLALATSDGESGVSFLQRKRLEWDGRSIDILEGRED